MATVNSENDDHHLEGAAVLRGVVDLIEAGRVDVAQAKVEQVRARERGHLRELASLMISEGRIMADAVEASGRFLQIGSQQGGAEPWPQFHCACELIRNDRQAGPGLSRDDQEN